MKRQKRFCTFCGKQLEQVKLDGRVRLYCPACDAVQYENPIPATAAVVFNGSQHLLLVKRGMEPSKGEWCLPGGFLEVDESPNQGVLRELQEETGLRGEVNELIDIVCEDSPLYGPLIIIGYRVSADGGDLQAGDDAAEVQFFPIDNLPHITFVSHQSILDAVLRRNG